MPKHHSSRRALLLVAVLTAAGCKHTNTNYCPGAKLDNCLDVDAAIDAPVGCTSDQSCSGAMAVCDLVSKDCVQCEGSDAAACVGVTPTCGSDEMCHACVAHADCASDACLPNGSCGDDSTVAYVDPTGTDNTMCTKATPCIKVAKALATMRSFVKFHGITNEPVSINNQNVTFLADAGAKLTDTSNGVLLEIKGTSQVAIHDLEVTGASGPSGVGLSLPTGNAATVMLQRVKLTNNTGAGISAFGGSLTVSQSTIAGNTGGGITIGGGATFVIVGNVFFSNGNNGSGIGGISITTSQASVNRLDFNSFNKNLTQDGVGPAIQCIAGTFKAKNNILFGNGTLTQLDQIGGTCTHAYSIVSPGALPAGTGNVAADPLFVSTTTGDLHIMASSPARHAADPAADLTGLAAHDLDGDTRVSPADIGADELP